MVSFRITEEDAGSIRNVLALFNHSRRLSIQQGSLTKDNVTLDWTKDMICLRFKDPPPTGPSEEV